jgi:hypothetical protein
MKLYKRMDHTLFLVDDDDDEEDLISKIERLSLCVLLLESFLLLDAAAVDVVPVVNAILARYTVTESIRLESHSRAYCIFSPSLIVFPTQQQQQQQQFVCETRWLQLNSREYYRVEF